MIGRKTVSVQPIEQLGDPRLVRALSHPMRVRVLLILSEREASAVEIARMVGADVGVVAYHVRKLAALGLISLTREARVRGAVQRFFRARPLPAITEQAWVSAPAVAKQAVINATLQQVHETATAASAAGGFARPGAQLERTTLRLDSPGFERVAEVLRTMLTEVEGIEAEASARLGGGGDPGAVDAGLVMMLFDVNLTRADMYGGDRPW